MGCTKMHWVFYMHGYAMEQSLHIASLRTCISTKQMASLRWWMSAGAAMEACSQAAANDLHLQTAGTSPASSISTWVNSRGTLVESYALPHSNPAGRHGCGGEVLEHHVQPAAARCRQMGL